MHDFHHNVFENCYVCVCQSGNSLQYAMYMPNGLLAGVKCQPPNVF